MDIASKLQVINGRHRGRVFCIGHSDIFIYKYYVPQKIRGIAYLVYDLAFNIALFQTSQILTLILHSVKHVFKNANYKLYWLHVKEKNTLKESIKSSGFVSGIKKFMSMQ